MTARTDLAESKARGKGTIGRAMIEHLRGRERALEPLGWTGREAEWIALKPLIVLPNIVAPELYRILPLRHLILLLNGLHLPC